MNHSLNVRISLDKRARDSDIDFVSHAHADHLGAVKSSKNVLASPQTVQLIEQARGLSINRISNDYGLRLLEAGHMLGSKQLCIDDSISGTRITYTGDFQMAHSNTAKPIDIVDTDVVIMDSTYPDSAIRFDDKMEAESAMQDWTTRKLASGTVIFSAYSMGKAQELISAFNNIGITPVVSRKVSIASKVYVQNGIRLNYASAYDEGSDYESIVRDNFVGITDARNLAMLRSSLEDAHNRRVYTAMATGFAKVFRFKTDAQFTISDHADFWQGVEYIEATGAKKVYTYGPNAEVFSENLNREGYNSEPFLGSEMLLEAISGK